jgi:hypothetical protein
MFERVANFRDLGGHRAGNGGRVRRRLLYRSASLDWMTAADAALARDELGLRTVVDLRAAHEVGPLEGHPLFASGVERHHAPLSNRIIEAGWECVPPYGVESYVLSLQHARPAIRGALERLATPGALPAVFHCAAGKDRTGIVAALLLELLGVSDEDIEQDYRASKPHLAEVARIAGRDPRTADPAQLEVHPPALLGTLAWVREHFGGAEAYLLVAGVSEGAIERLREGLVE